MLIDLCPSLITFCLFSFTVSEATGQVVASTQSGANVTRQNSTSNSFIIFACSLGIESQIILHLLSLYHFFSFLLVSFFPLLLPSLPPSFPLLPPPLPPSLYFSNCTKCGWCSPRNIEKRALLASVRAG